MGKIIKKMVIVTVGILLSLLIVIMTISFINHRIQLSQESALLQPVGTIVNVNDHLMHVYAEGHNQSPVTLVFMSGGGTSSPVLDFKGLYSQLSDQYRIAVVEKAGYGNSETASVPRDIDTILEETRSALSLAGEQGPYILFPHSMSGIEALHWAQQYPHEVKSIIGLDPAVPEAYKEYPLPSNMVMKLTSFAARIGITRWVPAIADASAAITEDHLTDDEKDIYRAMFYKNTQTSNMIEEVRKISSNAAVVSEAGIPDVPMYFFISNGEELPLNDWPNMLISYVEDSPDGKYMLLDSGHYIHNYETETIANESKIFIKSILEQ
ncbi:alpha/beta fold hydrolase [Paenibacillus sp. JCM 10914]|uniref:alpha/beta fold hydrolase n=1 Tax=Paenibacillus sp. JCM 10914 TaxID=1236974 RepID=UPI00068DED29|nr:alpha/beta fold hydrolase [Paenibacillus sp. JCM 10914]